MSGHSPAWSPDGEKIVFLRQSDDGDTIVGLNDEGSEERTLFRSRWPDAFFEQPAWSPDSSQIAFTWLGQDGVWVMDADGDNAHKLKTGPYTEPGELDRAAAGD